MVDIVDLSVGKDKIADLKFCPDLVSLGIIQYSWLQTTLLMRHILMVVFLPILTLKCIRIHLVMTFSFLTWRLLQL